MLFASVLRAEQDVSVPPNTPQEFRRDAASFARQRARALDAVDGALEASKSTGSSVNQSLVSGLEALWDEIKKRRSAIAAKKEDYTGAEHEALKELDAIYAEEYRYVRMAARDASKMLEVHDNLFDAIGLIEDAAKAAVKSRKKCVGYAEILVSLADHAAKVGAIKVVAGGDVQQAISAANRYLKLASSKETIGELLDVTVSSKRSELMRFLRQKDPVSWVKRLAKLKHSKFQRESEAWSTYQNRWKDSLESHLDEYDKAYEKFNISTSKPWLDFYKEYPLAAVGIMADNRKLIEGKRDDLVELASDEERKRQEQDALNDKNLAAAEKELAKLRRAENRIRYRFTDAEEKAQEMREIVSRGEDAEGYSNAVRELASHERLLLRLEEDLKELNDKQLVQAEIIQELGVEGR